MSEYSNRNNCDEESSTKRCFIIGLHPLQAVNDTFSQIVYIVKVLVIKFNPIIFLHLQFYSCCFLPKAWVLLFTPVKKESIQLRRMLFLFPW